MAATGTVSSPLTKFTPIIIKSRSATVRKLLREQAEEDRENAASHDAETEDGDSEDGENGEDMKMAKPVMLKMSAVTHMKKLNALNRARFIANIKFRKSSSGANYSCAGAEGRTRHKGAALTTYLSLAGRYCVLMPNTARGGGISRKINNATDRKKLKTIVGKLDVPDGMGLIVRTAGQRTLAEIRRDWQYLWRLWENVREITVNSSAGIGL